MPHVFHDQPVNACLPNLVILLLSTHVLAQLDQTFLIVITLSAI